MNKSKVILFIIFAFVQIVGFSQVAPNKYVVYFTDKENTPFNIDEPETFLTQRAIDRRVVAGIEIDSTDLPVDPVYLDSIETTGAKLLYKSNWFNFAVVNATELDIVAIEGFGFVHSVSKHYKEHQKRPVKDKFASEIIAQKSVMNTYTEVQQQINVDDLHQMGYRGAGVRIAVIDGGFTGMDDAVEFAHLFDEDRLIGARNVASESSIFSSHTHGTYVSSIMCADLGETYKGVANEAEYIIIRSETGATEYLEEEFAWVPAAEFADSLGADIINSSLGYSTFDWTDQNHTYDDLDGNTTMISRAAGLAFAKGILVFTSAGNSGDDPWYYVTAPADQPDIITVGSVDINGERSDFSSVGLPEHNYKPDVSACGDWAPYVSNGVVQNGSGTSFSSPLVAGAAACLWQSFPEKTNAEVASAIRASASLYPNGNNFVGYGIPNFAAAYLLLNDSSGLPSNTDIAELISVYKTDKNHLMLNLYTPVSTNVTINIYDLSGKFMYAETANLQSMTVNKISLKTEFLDSENKIILLNLKGDLFDETHKVSLF
jgi:serine protease AprX